MSFLSCCRLLCRHPSVEGDHPLASWDTQHPPTQPVPPLGVCNGTMPKCYAKPSVLSITPSQPLQHLLCPVTCSLGKSTVKVILHSTGLPLLYNIFSSPLLRFSLELVAHWREQMRLLLSPPIFCGFLASDHFTFRPWRCNAMLTLFATNLSIVGPSRKDALSCSSAAAMPLVAVFWIGRKYLILIKLLYIK